MTRRPLTFGRDAAAQVSFRAKAPIVRLVDAESGFMPRGPRVTGVPATDHLPTLAVPNRTNAPVPRLLEAERRFMQRGPRIAGVPEHGRPTAPFAIAAGRGAGKPVRARTAVPGCRHDLLTPTLIFRTGRNAGMSVHRPHAKEVSS